MWLKRSLSLTGGLLARAVRTAGSLLSSVEKPRPQSEGGVRLGPSLRKTRSAKRVRIRRNRVPKSSLSPCRLVDGGGRVVWLKSAGKTEDEAAQGRVGVVGYE